MSGKDTAGLRGFARALSQTERYVLMLFYAEGLTPTETGLVVALPECEVLAILDRVRGRARALLRKVSVRPRPSVRSRPPNRV